MNVPKLRFKEFDGEWEERKLKDLILTVEAGVSVNSKDASVSDTVSKAVLKTSAISKGNFNHKENKKVIEEDLERVKKPVKADTILVSRMNTPALVGEVGYVENDYPNLYLPDRLWEVEVDKEITTAKWLVSALVTDKNEYKIKSLGTGTSGSMKNIAKSDFLNINIKVPNLKEQIKIQSFIGILNKKIQLQQQKIDLLQEQKKGFLQKMFPKNGETVPELRFDGFTGDWKEQKLREIGKTQSGIGFPDVEQGGSEGVPFFKVSDMNIAGNEYEMITSNNYVSDEQLKRKKWRPIETVPAVIFAKVGAAIMLNRKRLVRTPFLIDNNTMAYVFDESWDTDFGKILFETVNLPKYAQVGALPSYNGSDIENIEVKVTNKDEQVKIGLFFNRLEHIINLHQHKLDLLEKQKKGFMQQMFI